ncbi:MAG TPA: hypothetical protein VMQ93_02000, partial [Novosphingobium sp.]|nr:hypothetical protein [Novosphingobium sp.]
MQFRVAIPAADPPDNITHDPKTGALARTRVCLVVEFPMSDSIIRYRRQWFTDGASARRDVLA